MKRICALMVSFAVFIGLAACGQREETGLTEEQQLLIDTLRAELSSEEFAVSQSLYAEFTGKQPPDAKAENITHYENRDFGDGGTDCYLVTLQTGVAYWTDEENGEKTTAERVYIFIDKIGGRVYDNIKTDSSNIFKHDTATVRGRVAYLLWTYENAVKGSHKGVYVNDKEAVTELTDKDLEIINSAIIKKLP